MIVLIIFIAVSIDMEAVEDAANQVFDTLEGLTIVCSGVFNAISRDKLETFV